MAYKTIFMGFIYLLTNKFKMKNTYILFFLMFIFSCSEPKKGDLEGSWIRTGTINYIGGEPVDTLAFKGTFFEVYTKGSYSLLMNEIKIDSVSLEDIDKGSSEAGMYILEGNKLKKKVYYGTGWIGELIDKRRDPTKGFVEVEFEVDYGNNHLSKLIRLDSIGNGFAEYYTRVE